MIAHVDGLVQERRYSSALEVELGLSCTNSSMCVFNLYTSVGSFC